MWKRSEKDKTEQKQSSPPTVAVSSQDASSALAVGQVSGASGNRGNAGDIADIKASVEEEIAKIERLIDAERRAYHGRAERLEEEKARLSAHLDLADNDLTRHLAAQNETIVSMRRKWGEDISIIESKIMADEKMWENKLKNLSSELENVKLSSRVEEESARASADSASLAVKGEIRGLESRLSELVARRRGEESSHSSEVKKREDDIAAIKAQISLRAGQLRLEEESFERERSDLDEKYRIRAKDLEDKLVSLRALSEKTRAAKQDELLSFETAVKQRRIRFEQEAAARKSALEEMKETLGHRIKDIESEMADEARRHEDILKEREERLDKIKVELMLSDTAADAERQSRIHDMAALKERAEKQLAELAKKYEQEKNDWDKKIAAADRGMEDARLDAQIKMRDMAASLDRARADIEKEKKALSARVLQLENGMLERKIDYEKAVSSKNTELQELKIRLSSEQERKASEYNLRLDDLASRKSRLETDLAAASAAREAAAKIYSDRIEKKNTEIEALRAAHQRDIAASRKAMELEESKIKSLLAPLEAHLSSAMSRKENLEKEHVAGMSALDESLAALERSTAERIRALSDEHAVSSARLSGEIESLENELKMAVAQKARIESEATDASRAAAAEKAALDKELFDFNERAQKEVNNLAASATAEKEKISAEINGIEHAIAAAEAERDRAVEAAKLDVAKAEKELEDKTASLSAGIRKEKSNLEARMNILNRDIEERRAEVKELKSSSVAALARVRRELAESRAALDAASVAAKEDYRARSSVSAAEIEGLKSVAADLSRRLAERKTQSEGISADAATRVRRMSEALENIESKNEAELSRLREEYERENRLIADEVEKIERDAESLKSEHAEVMNRLREEMEKTQSLRSVKISERDAALARLEAEHSRLTERHTGAITSLKAELSSVEERLPLAIAEKEKQVSALAARIAAAEERHAGAKDGYTTAHAQFVSRAESRKETLRRSIETIKEKHAAEIAAAQERLSVVEREYAAKENELRAAFEQKERLYKGDLARLEKIKEELEKTLREQTLRGRDELKDLDKKTYELEAQLAHREKSNEEDISRIRARHENEQKQFTDEVMMLRGNLGDITAAGAAALRAKNEEITFTSARLADSLENLGVEISDKENQWKEANSRLEIAISAIKTSIENQRAEWEKLKGEKEKELAALGSKIANWEYDVGMERERIRKEHETEHARLEKEIAIAASLSDKARRVSESALVAKQEELKKIEDDYAARRSAAESAWRDTGNELLKSREKLQAELAAKESEYREREAASVREAAALEKDIEDRKLKLALAVSEFESERIKTSRENKSVLKKLERDAASLLEKYTAYNEAASQSLAAAEEKIIVLSKRLANRDERIRNETDKRRQDAENYIVALRAEIDEVAAKAVAAGAADVRLRESLREDLARLEEEHLKVSPAIKTDDAAGRLSETAESLRSIEELEKIFDAERIRFAALLEAKMGKIDELENSLDAASKDILAESARRRDFMDNLRKQGARLAYKLRYIAGDLSLSGRSAATQDSDESTVSEDGKDDKNK
ncbi:MAG: hypothetical protein QME32_00605 [Endomicrobiia bacterium]|nr:hypothetical protein [Endomicrobiia bacterium]